jgi:LmbE family N-acetylglucosaminyl deacetylase
MYRLLCITAHPDDEAGAFGGTLALYADRGVAVSIVCLTAGTAARNRGTAQTELALRIRQLRPHVMLTFGPDGGLTGHPDHAMACAFATQAFQWAGRPDRYPEQLAQGLQAHRAQKLYWVTANFHLPDRMPTAPPPVSARIEVGPERFEKKIQAFMKHQTQEPLFLRLRMNLGKAPTQEMFHLAATREPRNAKPETDLFEGVTEE